MLSLAHQISINFLNYSHNTKKFVNNNFFLQAKNMYKIISEMFISITGELKKGGTKIDGK